MNLADFIRRAKLYALTSQQAHFVVEHRESFMVTNDPATRSVIRFVATYPANPFPLQIQ
jgi:hypothetical protein